MLFSNFEILIHIIKRWFSNKFHGFNIGSIDNRWLSTTIPQYKCMILWFIIWPTNIFLFLWPSWPQNCSPQTEKDTTSVSVTNSNSAACTPLRHENCQKILSCTLQYVTRPSENTAISFSSLFAKEDKESINIQYGVRKTTK